MSKTDTFSQYSPYCSSHCMNEHDKGIDHEKGSDKNVLLDLVRSSKVFEQ